MVVRQLTALLEHFKVMTALVIVNLMIDLIQYMNVVQVGTSNNL